MLRSAAPARSLLRSLNAARTPTTSSAFQRQFASQVCTMSKRPSALAFAKPLAIQLRMATKSALPRIDNETEAEYAKRTLPAEPDVVSTTSSTHPVFGEVATPEEEKDTEMLAGVKSDLVRSPQHRPGKPGCGLT